MTAKETIARIQQIVKAYRLPFDTIKSKYAGVFHEEYTRNHEWLGDLEKKTHLLENSAVRSSIEEVIRLLKDSTYVFSSKDIQNLSRFTGNINYIVRSTNFINNFKQDAVIAGEERLDLPTFFNAIKQSDHLVGDDHINRLHIHLNKHLNFWLRYAYAIIKHCQDPEAFPIYYIFWKNILREVFGEPTDYDHFTAFYRTLPPGDRHLNFGAYMGTVGTEIARQARMEKLVTTTEDTGYRYLKKNLLNIPPYLDILVESKRQPGYFIIGSRYDSTVDKFAEMMEKSVVSTGFASHLDLSDFVESPAELQEYLTQEGESTHAIQTLKDFLSLQPGDFVAVKQKGTPKDNQPFLSIIAIAQVVDRDGKVYRYDPSLGHTMAVKFLQAPVYKEFSIGKYSQTIHRVDPEDVKPIFYSDYKKTATATTTMQLNTVFFGPPGTGKTYHTISRAIEIVDPAFYQQNREDRKSLTKRFRELLIKDWNHPSGQIAFTTFHQSLSYEDFIEGIKPETLESADEENSSIIYEIQDGIFKLIVQKATWKSGNFDKVIDAFKEEINANKDKKPVTITSKFTTFDVIYRETTVLYIHPHTTKNKDAWYPVSIMHLRKVYENGDYTGVYNPTYVREILTFLRTNRQLTDHHITANEQPLPHVLIIDEINRGNIANIFGELITLIEPDKRAGRTEELEVILPYSKKPFTVPENVYIIGTMNTADRSVESMDTALRRRFHFEDMPPRYDLLSPARMLWQYWWDCSEEKDDGTGDLRDASFYRLLGLPDDMPIQKAALWPGMQREGRLHKQIDELSKLPYSGIHAGRLLSAMNMRIAKLLNKDYQIGHAYLINVRSHAQLREAFVNKLLPLLQEYFFADHAKIGLVIGKTFIKQTGRDVQLMTIDGYDSGDLNEKLMYELADIGTWTEDYFTEQVKLIYA